MSTKEFKNYREAAIIKNQEELIYNPVNYMYYVDFVGNLLPNLRSLIRPSEQGILNFFQKTP
jgi:hypothetical protein